MRRRQLAEQVATLENRVAYLCKIMGISISDQYAPIDIDQLAEQGESPAIVRQRITREFSDLNNRLMGVGAPLTNQDRERLSVLQRIDWTGINS